MELDALGEQEQFAICALAAKPSSLLESFFLSSVSFGALKCQFFNQVGIMLSPE